MNLNKRKEGKKMEINKNTTIGEILEKAPEKAELLLEVGKIL